MGNSCRVCQKALAHYQERKYNVHVNKIRAFKHRKVPIFWIIGGPCSGKTIICKRLALRFNLYHIDISQLIRHELVVDNETGNEVRKAASEGGLVPRRTIIEMILREMLDNCNNTRGFLVDGFPKTLTMGESFEKEIGSPALIFYFHCSTITMKKRLEVNRPELDKYELTEELDESRIYGFQRFFIPILRKWSEKIIRIDADEEVDIVYTRVINVIHTYLVFKRIGLPVHFDE